MRVSLSDGWIVVEVGSRPTPPQVRALRWLEDDGTLHLEVVGANVRFPARAWLDAGELPPVTASSEETDEWQRRHDEIGRLLNRMGQSVYVDAIGPLGGAGFQIQLTVDEQRLDIGVSSPVVNGAVLLPAVYKVLADLEMTRASWSRGDQIAALGRLKSQLTEAAQLLEGSSVPLSVTLHPHIADVEVRTVKRAALAWKSSSEGSRLLSLELDEVRDDESRERLPVEKLSSDAPVISISAKKHLLLPDEIAEVARVARRNRNLLSRNVERDPTRLLPQGFTYDSIDLSGYGVRVLGFEALHGKDSMPAPAAGVAWYQKDDQSGIPHVRLVLHDASGARHEREIPEADAPRLLGEAQTALETGGEIAIGGQSFPARTEVVEQLREHVQRTVLRDGTRRTSEPPPNAPSRVRQLAAVIDEHEGGGSPIPPIPEAGVPWAELDCLLRPEITLRDHQHHGIEWLWRHYRADRPGVLLADEMGLGKTLQVGCFLALQAACGRELDRKLSSLIVCPKVLIGNWITEMDRYFRPGAVPRTRELHRDWLRRGDADLLDNGPSNFFVTSYDTFARYQQELLRRTWATAVLDESQNIKNPDTYRTRAARGLKRTFAICATGTPVENRFRDLWTQFDFLSPGAPFGTAKEFCAAFESGEETPTRLRRALAYPSHASPILHREKREVLQALSPPNVRVHSLPMTRDQVDQEERIVRTEDQPLKILGDLQKLYQHPALLQPESDVALEPSSTLAASPKLAKCIELLGAVRDAGEKAIVFTLWTQMQELLQTMLHHAFDLVPVRIINGASNQNGQSEKSLKSFSSREGFDVLIMSPLAAGAGLNVTAANHVIHYGRWWNPAKEDQATARAHRMGQTREVHVHYLVLHHPDDPARGFDKKLHDYVFGKRQNAAEFLAPTESGELERLVSELRGSGK